VHADDRRILLAAPAASMYATARQIEIEFGQRKRI
jgi:hypothetical protein